MKNVSQFSIAVSLFFCITKKHRAHTDVTNFYPLSYSTVEILTVGLQPIHTKLQSTFLLEKPVSKRSDPVLY